MEVTSNSVARSLPYLQALAQESDIAAGVRGHPAFVLSETGSDTHIEVHFLHKDGESAEFHAHQNLRGKLFGDHKVVVGEKTYERCENEVLKCYLTIKDKE